MEPTRIDHRAREQHGEREDDKDCRYVLDGPVRMQPLPNCDPIMARAAAWESARICICWLSPLVSRTTTLNVVADINFSSMFPNRWTIHRESKNIKMMASGHERPRPCGLEYPENSGQPCDFVGGSGGERWC
jgi:hypothetical protein